MRRYGSKKVSQKANTAAAIALIGRCTDAALARLTVDTLVASYGLKPEDADQRLTAERAFRAMRT